MFSSILCYIESQLFVRCILQPSSSGPCLSEHRNYSIETGNHFLKVWLCLNWNHFYVWINKGHPRKAGGYSGRNVFQQESKVLRYVRYVLTLFQSSLYSKLSSSSEATLLLVLWSYADSNFCPSIRRTFLNRPPPADFWTVGHKNKSWNRNG